jgi:hypothetical protein
MLQARHVLDKRAHILSDIKNLPPRHQDTKKGFKTWWLGILVVKYL